MPGLILVPTPLELDLIGDALQSFVSDGDWRIEICGFGPIAAAARTATLIERLSPSQVSLLGLAGSYSDAHPIGSATTFQRVHCWGVGAGSDTDFQSAAALGFDQISGEPRIGDCIELVASPRGGVLLTTCSASSNEQEAAQKLAAVPTATAEDMEGFGVALSCRLAGVPLTIVRGISNRAGDRNKTHWEIESAIRAAVNLLMDELTRQS